MTGIFNPPPNWPRPPIGWLPPPGWKPDPAWGPPPSGWQLWIDARELHEEHAQASALQTSQRVFISYRRSDCQPQANGLHDGLRHRITSASIFMDIDSIPPGVDFEQHIRKEIEVCDVVLVLIGDNWLDSRPGTDVRRLDEPDDFVRLEIESAFSSGHVRVIPVLVEGAQMPSAADLPETIRRLSRINAIELSDRRWTSDLARLAQLIEQIGRETTTSGEQETLQRNVRFSDIDEGAVATAIDVLPQTFRTKDVSEESGVLRAHAYVSDAGNYHTMIGRYLAANHSTLGLQPPGPATDARGAVWRKLSLGPSAQRDEASSLRGLPNEPSPAPGELAARPGSSGSRTPPMGWVMVALPTLSCGLAAFVPALWAAWHHRDNRTSRNRLYAFAGLMGTLLVLGFVLLGTSPEDADGNVTGLRSDIGASALLCSILLATIVAVFLRKPPTQLPGAAEELARRRRRAEYRNLVNSDVSLARSIGVGRPDLARDFDDGGLLDLNGLTAEHLSLFGRISTEEAGRIVDTRQRLGRLSSIDELTAYANVSESTVGRLAESAVFL